MGPSASDPNIYETNRLRDEYLLFHYGRPEEILPYDFGPSGALNFPGRAVRECLDRLPSPGARALDVGCAVGRTSFELVRFGCAEVVGVDFSASFINAARILRDVGQLPYRRAEEGSLATELVAELPADMDRTRARFEVGDACALNVEALGGAFDVVVALNLLCRLPEPRRFLSVLPELVKPGGQLLLATPCSWLSEFTAPERWLGGFADAEGRPVRTLDSLRTLLTPDFELIRVRNLPFLIREHARKFQWSVSQGSVWRRK